MPPHPDYVDEFGWKYETVFEMRRRLNITYGYNTQHLDPEHCRHLSEEVCRRDDEALGERRNRRREKLRCLQERQDQAGQNGTGHQHRKHNPAIGKFNVLVLLIQFPDTPSSIRLAHYLYINSIFNSDSSQPDDKNPAGSIRKWFEYNSGGRYDVQFTVVNWDIGNGTFVIVWKCLGKKKMHALTFLVHSNLCFPLSPRPAPHPEAYYTGDIQGRNGTLEMQELFKWKLDEMDRNYWDWKKHDADGDGVLDHLLVLHSGFPAEVGEAKACAKNPNQRIWSQVSSTTCC